MRAVGGGLTAYGFKYIRNRGLCGLRGIDEIHYLFIAFVAF